MEEGEQVVLVEALERVDLAAREERTDYLERRVFGRCSDERDGARLHGGEERVLLRLGETVYFIDEENGTLLSEKLVFGGAVNHFAHFFHPAVHGRQGVEGCVELVRDDLGEGGFAHARRPPENEGGNVARIYHFAQHSTGGHEVALADVLVERSGAEAFG